MVQVVNDRPQTLLAAARYYNAENAAAYIASIKWPDGPCCPKCGSVSVGTIASRGKFQCREKGCRKQFSLVTGTIMESSHLRLDQWILAVWMIANCRNGVSSCEIARTVGCKQQSAWHLLHRVRHLFTQDRQEPMTGVVEVDETFVGGRYEFMHADRRERAMARGRNGKTIVVGMLERRTGNVRAGVIPDATVKIMREQIFGNVVPGSEIHTDKAGIYGWVKGSYTHRSVNHGAGQYVDGHVTTNGLEGFFNCLRRGLKGTYIKATPKHLDAYVDEQVWRYNVRKQSEWERFNKAMQMIVGKRLSYTELTNGAVR